MKKEIVIDAENHVLGRLATFAAKRVLEKNNIVIVNAEKTIITGNKNQILERFRKRLKITTKANPMKGPKYPKRPDGILRRAIRGMLPYKKSRGREAYHRVKVFIGLPEKYENKELKDVNQAKYSGTKKYYTLEEISKILGARW